MSDYFQEQYNTLSLEFYDCKTGFNRKEQAEVFWNHLMWLEPFGQDIFFWQSFSFSQSVGKVRRNGVPHQRRHGDDNVTFAVIRDELAGAHVAVVDDVVVAVPVAGIPNAFAKLSSNE